MQTGNFFRSGSSYDFNPSIVANSSKEVWVTWSATDPPNSVNAEMRMSGRQAGDAAGSIPSPGTTIFTSPVPYLDGHIFNSQGQYIGVNRWGDYSAVALDPSSYSGCSNQRRAWADNEKVDSSSAWSTRIAELGFC